MYNENKIM